MDPIPAKEIRASVTLDRDACTALIRASLYRKADPKKRFTVSCILCGCVFVLSLLYLAFFGLDGPIAALIAALALLFAYVCFAYLYLPKKQYKALGKLQNAVQHYTFTENSFHVSCDTEGYTGENTSDYSVLTRAKETGRYLFLYPQARVVHAVDLRTLEGGTVEDLRALLLPALGKKYIVTRG